MTQIDEQKDEITLQREKKDKVAKSALELRQELRNGRANKTSGTTGEPGQSAGGVSGHSDPEKRTTLQAARGKTTSLAPTGGIATGGNRRDRSHRRGVEAEPERIGRTDRRDGESNGGPTRDTETDERAGGQRATATVGRLEADEPVFLRPDNPPASFEAGQGRALPTPQGFKEDYVRWSPFGRTNGYALKADKKQRITDEQYAALKSRSEQPPAVEKPTGPGQVIKESLASGNVPWFHSGQVLSKREAEDLAEPLQAAIQDDLHYLDELLWLRYPHGAGKDIWGNLDNDEAGVLVRMMLKRGQQSPAAAATVRAIVDSKDYIATAEIIVPRAVATYRLVKTAPDRPHRQFSLFRKAEGTHANQT